MRCESVDDPVPGVGEVLVRMESIGVNFIEMYFRKGLYKTPLPYTPGTEGAGTVVVAGHGVSDVAFGDRVAILARNSHAFVAVRFAVARLGRFSCPSISCCKRMKPPIFCVIPER